MKIRHFDRIPKPDPEKEEAVRKEGSKLPLSDRFVMVLTAFVWIFLPCVAVLLLIAVLSLLLFGVL